MYLYAIYNFCFWHLHEKWPFINKYCSTLTKLLHLLHIHTEKWPDQISYSWWNIDTHIPGFTTNNSEGNRLTKSTPLFHNSKRERDWFYQKLSKRNLIFEILSISKKIFCIDFTNCISYTVYLLGYFLCGWLNHALIICAKVQRTPQG